MGFKGIVFANRRIVKPGVYSNVNTDALVPNRVGPANTIGVIGIADGGKPRSITTINSPVEARAQLRDGVLLRAIELMYDPSGELPGAGQVKYHRINNAVQGSLTLKDAGAVDVIAITARDYGVWTNQIRVKVENGSVSGKKVTVNNVLEPNILESDDNLGRAFQVQYIGAIGFARMSIIKTGDVATSLTVETSPDEAIWTALTPTVDLTNPNLNTVGKLVDFLDGVVDLDVTVQGDADIPVADLDALTNQDIKTAPVMTTAVIGAIVLFLNTISQLVSAARVVGGTNAPNSIPFTFLAGGSEGPAVTNQDWSDALDAFLTEDVNLIFVTSDQAAIHAMALAHCTFASDVKQRKERITIVGGASSETVEDAVTRAQGLSDRRSALVYPGIQRLNLLTGTLDSLSPMYAAAIVTGLAAGVTVETPLTFKQIRVSGLEKKLTLTEIERLLDRGVMPLELDSGTGTFRIVQGITTHLRDANVVLRKVAGIRIADFLAQEARDSVQRFVGKATDKRTANLARNAVENRMGQLTRSDTNLTGILTAGVDANGLPDPAIKNLHVVFDGFDKLSITFEAHPVGEVAYITISTALTPTKIVAAAA